MMLQELVLRNHATILHTTTEEQRKDWAIGRREGGR